MDLPMKHPCPCHRTLPDFMFASLGHCPSSPASFGGIIKSEPLQSPCCSHSLLPLPLLRVPPCSMFYFHPLRRIVVPVLPLRAARLCAKHGGAQSVVGAAWADTAGRQCGAGPGAGQRSAELSASERRVPRFSAGDADVVRKP